MTLVADASLARRAPIGVQSRHDRLFFGTMAIVLAVIVFAGFGPTYYFRFFGGGPQATVSGKPFSVLVHLHGALFTSWVLLFVVQTALVASRRVAVHRRLGVVGAVLAGGMIVVGTLTAIEAAGRGATAVGIDPLAFMAIPMFDMVLFATFIVAALVSRRNKDSHKRLMLLAYAVLITAAIARIGGISAQGPLVFFGLSFLVVVCAVLYDYFTRGRVHPAYIWGGALIFIMVPARLAISGTAAWHSFAAFLVR
jgi:hypothetical protein